MMGEEPADKVLDAINKQIAHVTKPVKEGKDLTDYQRGFVSGLRWAKTEIQKVFEK
jgi:hypothetical protein